MSIQPSSVLQIVGVRYRGSRPAQGKESPLDAYASSGVYETAGRPFDLVEPRFPEEQRCAEEPENLGLLGGAIADAVATARRQGRAVLLTGGDCTHLTGMLGGLQQAHGPAARIGLVWFDAHGDFNTPKTTISGMLGGMPVAVSAGLAYPGWRERSRMVAPIPTDRILMVDVRNLDPAEERLIRATDIEIAAPAPGFPGRDLQQAVTDLASRCDLLYLHVDADILDERFVPNHMTKEPHGPDLQQVLAAITTVMETGKVVAYGVVSICGEGEGSEKSLAAGVELIRAGLQAWRLPEA
ncbi:MAG: arginase [Nitrospinota bacterium]|nr:MAG: arginase [Nitrospinota bacterium]